MLQHGIDLHKRSLSIATVDRTGRVVKQKRLPTQRANVIQYLEALPGPHRAVVEACGSWYWLADLFATHDVELNDPELRGYRDLLRTRLRLVGRRTTAKSAVSSLLERYNQPRPAGASATPGVSRRSVLPSTQALHRS